MLRVDGDQMKQAFYNLIKNAYQAMGTGGRLTVSTESDQYEIRIIVTDTGKGISRESMGPNLRALLYHQGIGHGTWVANRSQDC